MAYLIAEALRSHLGVNEGDHDVSGAIVDLETLVIMSQSSRVHHGPALLGIQNAAVVSNESYATALIWDRNDRSS